MSKPSEWSAEQVTPPMAHLEMTALAAGGTHQSMRVAHAEERVVQGEALSALIAAVLPALPALVSPMVIDITDDTGAPFAVEGEFYRLGPPSTGKAGALYLDSGGLIRWTNWQTRRWEIVEPHTAARAAVWPIEQWVRQLAESCLAVSTGRGKKGAAAAKRRAVRLRAIAVLLDWVMVKVRREWSECQLEMPDAGKRRA